MKDYKSYVAESPKRDYSLIHMVRDGLGIMSFAIIGYVVTCGMFVQ